MYNLLITAALAAAITNYLIIPLLFISAISNFSNPTSSSNLIGCKLSSIN
jgi:hypothetical protein